MVKIAVVKNAGFKIDIKTTLNIFNDLGITFNMSTPNQTIRRRLKHNY